VAPLTSFVSAIGAFKASQNIVNVFQFVFFVVENDLEMYCICSWSAARSVQ
jgi:hypothetical protein